MVSVFHVADYFLSLSEPGTSRAITHLKLQKLVYYAQAYHLAILDEPLFVDRIEAWVHGPVCPDLYSEYKHYYSSEIPRIMESINIPSASKKVIDMVWSALGVYDGSDLEEFTHQEDPWINARKDIPSWQAGNTKISDDDIKSYFKKLLSGDN